MIHNYEYIRVRKRRQVTKKPLLNFFNYINNDFYDEDFKLWFFTL